MNAHDILQAAAGHMRDRAATYDKPEGERSMGATVAAFRAVTGLEMTETQGWLFMALLKAVRSQQGAYRADSFEDLHGIAQSPDLVVLAAKVVIVIPADIQIYDLIHAPLVEALHFVNGVADDLMDSELLAPDQKAVLEQQNRNESMLQHSDHLSIQFFRIPRPFLWLFSG